MTQIAQFLWIGPRLSRMERLCLRSFVDVGYEVHLYAYEPIANVPEGVVVQDGRAILPADQIFARKSGFGAGGYANFSDRFRYHLLHKRGGWWFDMDFAALKLMPEPTDLRFASTWELEFKECAMGCAMWSAPGDDRMGELADRCDVLVKSDDLDFGAMGPFLIQALVRERGLEANVAPWWEFCPFPWRMVNRMAYLTNREWATDCLRYARHLVWERTKADFRAGRIRAETRAVHWHNEIWRSQGKDKDAVYHPGSPYGRLQRRHGLDRETLA